MSEVPLCRFFRGKDRHGHVQDPRRYPTSPNLPELRSRVVYDGTLKRMFAYQYAKIMPRQ